MPTVFSLWGGGGRGWLFKHCLSDMCYSSSDIHCSTFWGLCTNYFLLFIGGGGEGGVEDGTSEVDGLPTFSTPGI